MINKNTFKDFNMDGYTASKLAEAVKMGKTIVVQGTQGRSEKTRLRKLINNLGGKAVESFDTYTVTLDYKED